MIIDKSNMDNIDDLPFDNDENGIYAFAQEAKDFLLSKKWCKKIKVGYIGLEFEGILGVFYFEIEPTYPDVDKILWVITGDLPPAYLVTDNIPNPPCAIAAYIEEMKLWVKAVRNKESLENVIPINVSPTEEYADMLDKRLAFLEENILPDYSKELEGFYKQ